MTRIGGLRGAVAITAIALTRMVWAQADTVQGTITAGATQVSLASGMALSYRTPNGPLISVLLSDKPADLQAFAVDTKIGAGEYLAPGIFEGAWKSQHIGKKLSGFTFSIAGKANVFTDEFLVGGRNNTFSLSAEEYVLELKSTSPRLVGRIRTRTPIVEAGSIKAGLDATFDLVVAPRP